MMYAKGKNKLLLLLLLLLTTWKSYFKNNEKNTWKFLKNTWKNHGNIMEFVSPKKWEP